MPLPTRITLPPSGRPSGGLLSAARPLGGDWWRGVTFSSGQCLPPQVVGTCTDGASSKTPNALSDAAAFDPFSVLQAIECSTLGRSDLEPFAAAALDVTREYGVASEFLTGDASGNPSLSGADTLGSASDPVSALGCLEQFAAGALFGRLAFIHAAPQIATSLLSSFAMWRDGNLWRTASGNIVVVSPGYDGRGPDDAAAPDPGAPMFLYATGEVYAAVGQRDSLVATERGQNGLQAIAEDVAVIAFDPCFNVAIDSGLNACVGIVS